MKFNYKLSHNENMDAWQEHSFTAPHTPNSSLTSDEKAWLLQLNESLRQLEDKYFPILNTKYKELQARVDDPSDWMNEFNLGYVVTFYLREDDPEYEDTDDNILMELQNVHFIRKGRDRDWGFGATHIDHAISLKCLSGEHHCYTYHQLNDHCHLDWRDLLRIGNLYVDIKIEEQSGMLNAIQHSKNEELIDVLTELQVGHLKPGKYRPLIRMDESSLNELAASIKEAGVIQPILVRMLPDGSYEIIAGERRWRAAQLAGMNSVPVIMKKARESGALEHALIENIQRKDLNHIEEALCIQRLIDECQMSLQAAANAVGRSSSATSNLLQLLKLSQPVQAMFMAGDLEIGHARVLLPLEETTQIAVANKIIQGGLSVRAAEKLVKSELTPIVKQEHK